MAWLWFKKNHLNLDTILGLHKKIMRVHLKDRKDQLGKWRTVNVRVGNRICPEWQEVNYLIANWCRTKAFARTESEIKIAHVEYEKIHPFIDGNGRTGRMIMNWQRVKNGLKPLCIYNDDKQEYYMWFEEP